jgi:hypothetical protein
MNRKGHEEMQRARRGIRSLRALRFLRIFALKSVIFSLIAACYPYRRIVKQSLYKDKGTKIMLLFFTFLLLKAYHI